MEQSNQLFDYAVTLSLLPSHKLNRFCLRTFKKYFSELDVQEQDDYLKAMFSTSLSIRSIAHEYTFEYHPNTTMGNGKPKRHLHGIIRNITKETASEINKLMLER
jgi:hypothetical protein